ncbi:helix-turn-helix domain-containing protein [Nocardiopsis rhodophaea]
MDPEQRRAMIVAAALPLVIEYGASVTTAKIARAAGIGEGTIFRVFPDKEALLDACLIEVTRPDDTVSHLEVIELDQPLAARLTEAAEVVRGYLARMGAVMGALAAAGRLERPSFEQARDDGRAAAREAVFSAPRAALAALFELDRDALRFSPERLADSFQRMLMSADRPVFQAALTTDELVDLFLHGASPLLGRTGDAL